MSVCNLTNVERGISMKSSDLKVVAIILAIALFFTIVTSNAVSIASVVLLAKGGISGLTSGTADEGTQTPAGDNNSSSTGTPAGNNSSSTQTPADNSGTSTQTPADNSGTSTQTPADNGNEQKPADNGNEQKPADNGNGQKPADNGNEQKPAAQKSAKEVLDIYTKVMTKAKTDKPAYTKVEWQELPDDANSRVVSEGANLVGTLLNLVNSLGIMTDKAKAEANPEIKEAGSDMRWFPVYKNSKGCYLTDTNLIKEYNYQQNGDVATITIVLKDELNPEPMGDGTETYVSAHGAMFGPLAKKDIDDTINGGAVQKVIQNVTYSLTYHDCTAILEYNTKTNEIVNLTQYMRVCISGAGKIFGIKQITIDKQELIDTMICKDFKY